MKCTELFLYANCKANVYIDDYFLNEREDSLIGGYMFYEAISRPQTRNVDGKRI